MSNYKVEIYVPEFSNHPNPLKVLNIKVKHFRQSGVGMTPSIYGGHTCIFEPQTGMVFSSRCRDDETFSRRKGILTCLQKMFDNSCFKNELAKYSFTLPFLGGDMIPSSIYDWEFTGNGVKVYLTPTTVKYQFLSSNI